jgi:hypothetical protein
MADESEPQFAVRSQEGFVRLSAKRGHGRMPHQTPELRSALAESRIAKRCLNHPVTACILDEIWKRLALF